jgi:hypothetical protein
MKLIDKDALVAEIERRKQTWQHQDQQYVNGGKDVCDYLLGFLDTLEVKEVDLDAELEHYKADQNIKYEEDINMFEFAKHFFELGLQAAQKGERDGQSTENP